MTQPVRNGKIRITQGTVFWREVGYGPTLIFLHGSWQDGSQWLSLMEQLGQHFHCLAPDLLGFGESSRLASGKYSVDLEIDCLTEYLVGLRVKPHVLIADSLGAWVATRYSLRHPEQVQGLILMAPEGLTHATLDKRWHKIRWLASPWSVRARGLPFISPFVRLLRGDRWLQRIQNQRQQFRRYQAACQLLFQRRRTALRSEWLNEALPQLEIPVLLLQPEQASDETQLANTLLQELTPKAHLLTLPGNESTIWQTAVEKIHAFAKAGKMGTIAQ